MKSMRQVWFCVMLAALAGCGGSGDAGLNVSEPLVVVPALLESLSPEDRALVEKQKTCPVNNELLGCRDVPIKTKVGRQVVFVCCEGCQGRLKKDPKKYLSGDMQATTK